MSDPAGSYTVEAALLMGLILPLLAAVIYLGFFLHDRGFVQAAAHETASLASLHRGEPLDMNGTAAALIEGRLLGGGAAGSISMGEREVSVEYAGRFPLPGLVRQFFGSSGARIGTKVSLYVQPPSRRIAKLRGIVKVIERIRG